MAELGTLEKLSKELDMVVGELVPLGGSAARTSEKLAKLGKEFEKLGGKVPVLKKVSDQIGKVVGAENDREATRALLDLLAVGPLLRSASAKAHAPEGEIAPLPTPTADQMRMLKAMKAGAKKEPPPNTKDKDKWAMGLEGRVQEESPKRGVIERVQELMAQGKGPYFYVWPSGRIEPTRDSAGAMWWRTNGERVSRFEVYPMLDAEGYIRVAILDEGTETEVWLMTAYSDIGAVKSGIVGRNWMKAPVVWKTGGLRTGSEGGRSYRTPDEEEGGYQATLAAGSDLSPMANWGGGNKYMEGTLGKRARALREAVERVPLFKR